jgi:hypothetical protein
MGCAYITNNCQVKINEVDISGEVTKPHKSELNVPNFLQEKSDDIVIVNDLRKIGKVKENKSRTKNNRNIMSKKYISSNSLETNFSGPIITLLRNKVNNYQRKKF